MKYYDKFDEVIPSRFGGLHVSNQNNAITYESYSRIVQSVHERRKWYKYDREEGKYLFDHECTLQFVFK